MRREVLREDCENGKTRKFALSYAWTETYVRVRNERIFCRLFIFPSIRPSPDNGGREMLALFQPRGGALAEHVDGFCFFFGFTYI